jgi:RNA polymerase sigma-70 factor (ECF subfamily)
MAVQQREEAVQLADRLSQLPADYRQVLMLRNLQSLPFEEVARQMDRSVGATRMLWLRAIERLRAVYGSEAPSES